MRLEWPAKRDKMIRIVQGYVTVFIDFKTEVIKVKAGSVYKGEGRLSFLRFTTKMLIKAQILSSIA